jgi:long-chain acyl-CoA synthetase
MLIADRFLCWAERTPDKAAIVLGDHTTSYGDLRERAEQVATRVRAEWNDRPIPSPGLLPSPCSPQPCCGLMLTHGASFISVFLGVTMAGAVAMVLDPKWTPSDVARVLSAAPPALLFVDPAHAGAVPSSASGIRVIVVGGSGISLDRMGSPESPDLAPCRVSPDAPFYIGFTSGTTGEPKAFLRSHRSWLASMDAAAVEFPIGAEEHVLAPGRLLHSLFLYAVVETLSSGATVHLMHDFEADAGLGILRRQPVTRIHGVPTMYTALCTAAADARFPVVRTLLSGGAKLSPRLKSRLAGMFPQATITEYYGASELSFVTVSQAECPADSVGRPFHGVCVALRRDDGSEVAPGEIGRLYVRSDMVCSGYLRAHDNTGFRTEDGWATVGDLAWRDENGFIYLAGRREGMMISGGLNVYPAEVEAVLQALPEVAEAAVFGLPDPYWGERVCAVVRWTDRARLNRNELRERCSQRLDRRKCPQQFFAIDQFAHTQSGKIAVAALRGKLLAGLATLPEIR